MTATVKDVYLNPHQARRRAPTQYEDLLGEHLNRTGPGCPHNQGVWTEANYQEEIARLAA